MMKLFSMFFILMIFTGCRYQSQFDTLKSLAADREYLETNANTPLDNDKQVVIERYFSNIKELSHKLVNDRRFSNNFHKRFFRYFTLDMCDDFVLDVKNWKQILNTCEVSGFYLCAEELKHYQDILKLVPSYLTKLEITNLKKEAQCKDKLVGLGVFDENN